MAKDKIKIIRATTIPMSLKAFCDGMLKELSEKYEVVAVSSPGEDLDFVAEREDVRTIAMPMERHISLWKDLKSLVRMIGVFRKERPYMVHSMTPKAGLTCMMAGWLTRVPVRVHTFTGLVWPTSTGLKPRILMLTDKILCACATHIIPEGQGVMDDLRNGGITKKPMRVLGYGNVKGVDMEYFDPLRVASELNTNYSNNTNCSINTPSSVELNTNDRIFPIVCDSKDSRVRDDNFYVELLEEWKKKLETKKQQVEKAKSVNVKGAAPLEEKLKTIEDVNDLLADIKVYIDYTNAPSYVDASNERFSKIIKSIKEQMKINQVV